MEMLKTELQLKVINTIKELRQNQKMSQALISDIIGSSSYGLIGNIESPRYKHKYTLRQLHLLCQEFSYPIERLFLNEEELALNREEYTKCLIEKIVEYDR